MKDKQNKKQKSNQFNEEVGAEIMNLDAHSSSTSNKKQKNSKNNNKSSK